MTAETPAVERPGLTRSAILGALIAAVGGALALIQSVLPWEQVTYGKGVTDAMSGLGLKGSSIGIDMGGGKIAIIFGALAIVLAVAWLLRARIPAIPVLVLVVGVLLVILGVANFIVRQNDVSDFNKSLETIKGYGVDTTGSSYAVGIGIFLTVLSGLLVAAGGALGLRKRG
jgi:hypothetical protein